MGPVGGNGPLEGANLQKRVEQRRHLKVQINNDTKMVSSQQTVLESSIKDFEIRIPYNCRAGICGACEALHQGQRIKTCYTPVKDGMRIVTLDHEMNMLRQGTADE